MGTAVPSCSGHRQDEATLPPAGQTVPRDCYVPALGCVPRAPSVWPPAEWLRYECTHMSVPPTLPYAQRCTAPEEEGYTVEPLIKDTLNSV